MAQRVALEELEPNISQQCPTNYYASSLLSRCVGVSKRKVEKTNKRLLKGLTVLEGVWVEKRKVEMWVVFLRLSRCVDVQMSPRCPLFLTSIEPLYCLHTSGH